MCPSKKPLGLLFLGLLTLGLAACAAPRTEMSASPVPSAEVGSNNLQPSLTPTGTTALAPAQATQAPAARTIRQDQYATDPTTVDLANGRPTLVKFFAFW